MDTALAVILAAYGYSKHNVRGSIASEAGELLPLVARRLAGYFAEAARINQTVFAVSVPVAYDATVGVAGWPRPTEIESVIRIELADGTEVKDVALGQLDAEPTKPCVYGLGQVYRPAGNDSDPDEVPLTFIGPKVADVPALIDSPLDALWPRQFSTLLTLCVAIYLARKDGRVNEIAALEAEKVDEHGRYVMWLEHESASAVRAHTAQRRINPPGARVG